MDQLINRATAYYIPCIILLASSLYGEYQYIRKGRPLFYQLVICVSFISSLSNIYNTLSMFLFDKWWDGISLTVIASFGLMLLIFGAITEMMEFMKSKGIDCSIKNGFGLKTVLLACISLIPMIICCILIIPLDGPGYSVLYMVFMSLPVYASALIVFRMDDENGITSSLRLPCCAIMLDSIAVAFCEYTVYLSLSAFFINNWIHIILAVLILIAMERGSRKWISQ